MTQTSESFSRLLWRTENAVDQAVDKSLASLGLSSSLLGTLRIIATEPGISTAEIARRSQVRPQSIAQAVARLEYAQLVERRPHPVHGKVMQIYPTLTAKPVLRKGNAALKHVEGNLLNNITPEEHDTFVELLARITANAHRIASHD